MESHCSLKATDFTDVTLVFTASAFLLSKGVRWAERKFPLSSKVFSCHTAFGGLPAVRPVARIKSHAKRVRKLK
jgi:hypothetical protein